MLSTGYFEVRAVRLIAAAIALVGAMVAGLLVAPGVAHAYEVHVRITGSGTVDEDYALSQANILDPSCSSPQWTPTGTVGANCFPGDPSGDYGYGWTVRWKATPSEGWEFVHWRTQSDDPKGGSSSTPVICDGANGSSTYTGQSCQFQTYDNLQTQAVFKDVTAPTANITGGPAAGSTSGRSVDFDFGVTNHPAGQPVSYRCKLTGPDGVVQDWSKCESDRVTSAYSGLSDGSHTFEVEAKDPSGNSNIASRTWNVDAIAPETTLTADGPAEGSTVASSSASFWWTGSADTQKYFCQVDSGSVIDPCSSPHSTGTLPDGTHSFKVWAEDTHGNVESSPAMRSWTIDTVAPSGTVSINDGATYTRSAAVNLTLSSSDAASMRFSNDTITWSEWDSYANARPWPLTSGDGTKTVYAQYKDRAGNVSATVQDSITLDTTAPTLDITSGPDGGSYTEGSTQTWAFSASDATSGVQSVQCKVELNGSPASYGPCSGANSWHSVSNLPAGTHKFYVRATDSAGNVTPEQTRSFSIVLPSLRISDARVSERGPNAYFTVQLSAPSQQTITVNYTTANGTAKAPADYATRRGALTFLPGQTAQRIAVPIKNDRRDERTEFFSVNLSGANNATIVDGSGRGTIVDNDR